ncbi:Innexin unc-7 [Clonorchis sinensis]|uniref:Innexin n=1 Tax=Clonorchis sinensis TaxID=79923 RepID=A0A419PL68_CLOSI|nr:Innexin unc-7 [Clonorchis sinensis]
MDAAFIWNLSKLGRIGSRRLQFDDDFADRLNYQYTGVLLFLFIGLIGVRQYVGKPIQCWIPQEFTRGWEEYAENYCWVANTYFAPVQDRLPPVPDRRELLLVYYQWAPIVMAAQALLFYLPCLTWRLSMAHSGFNLHRILNMAADANEMVPETASKTVCVLAHYIRNCIQRHRVDERRFPRLGTYSRLANDKTNSVFADTVLPNVQIANEHGLEMNQNGQTELEKMFQEGNGNLSKNNNVDGKSEDVSAKSGSRPSLITEANQHGRTRKPAPPPPSQSSTANSAPAYSSPDYTCPPVRSVVKMTDLSARNTDSRGPKTLRVDKTSGPGSHASAGANKCNSSGKKRLPTSIFPRCGRKHGNFLISLYIAVKFCYLFNVVGQIYLMQSFIGTKYTSYGARVLIDLIQGREWHHSGHFPRVTFCDLEAKKLGKNHVYTLQCVLPLNMFLEKIYIFLWFWHVAIAMITLLSLLVWLYRMFASHSRVHFVHSYLKPENSVPLHSALLEEFVDCYLGHDGMFIIRLISTNCGGILACDLVNELWFGYTEPKREALCKQTPEDKRKWCCGHVEGGGVHDCKMFHTVIIPENYHHTWLPLKKPPLSSDSVGNLQAGPLDNGCHICQMLHQDVVRQTGESSWNLMQRNSTLPDLHNGPEKVQPVAHRQPSPNAVSTCVHPSPLRNSNGDDIV